MDLPPRRKPQSVTWARVRAGCPGAGGGFQPGEALGPGAAGPGGGGEGDQARQIGHGVALAAAQGGVKLVAEDVAQGFEERVRVDLPGAEGDPDGELHGRTPSGTLIRVQSIENLPVAAVGP